MNLLLSRPSVVSNFDLMDYRTQGFPVLRYPPKFVQTHVYWVSDAIQSSYPLLSPYSLALDLSQYQVFSNESVLCIRWPKHWSFSFSISPSNEHPGLISFSMNWLDLQGTLKSLESLQHHSSKASILWWSAFLWSNSHIHTWLLEKTYLWLERPLSAK